LSIPAWPGEADDQFIADWIGHAAHGDRDLSWLSEDLDRD
jgi:hypothetical protein